MSKMFKPENMPSDRPEITHAERELYKLTNLIMGLHGMAVCLAAAADAEELPSGDYLQCMIMVFVDQFAVAQGNLDVAMNMVMPEDDD